MTAALPNLFKGIALVIDNGIGNEAQIDRILENINEGGGHYITLAGVPDDTCDLEHFAKVAFFIMDWNLIGETGVALPEGLEREMVARNIAFLRRLGKSRHAPVFIFTNNAPADVIAELKDDPELCQSVEDNHILVRSKAEVVDRLYEVLEGEYVAELPSVLTLKMWERAYHKAANQLFIDLHNRTPYWPVIMWETFSSDDVPADFEMARLINRLVEARMEPLGLDLQPFVEKVEQMADGNRAKYLKTMYSVLEGERFLRGDRLTDGIYAPGDVFCFTVNGDQKVYKMNIRAECDCLHGNDTELYLLKMQEKKDAESQIDRHNGKFMAEKDNEAVVHAMFAGTTYAVQFRDLKIKKVTAIQAENGVRVGRLLPPFLTRVQQRYAGYFQRPGLPKVPATMLPAQDKEKAA
jgi:hypothetical protein